MPTQSNFHDQAYEYYSWQELGDIVFELGKQIVESGKEFDMLVALSKGGLTFARSILDYLKIPDVSTIKIEFYKDIASTQPVPVITQSLPVNIKDQNVLIYDDLIDSGETLKLAKQYLSQHGAKTIESAVLFKKHWTKFESDYFVKETGAWIIFPNETRETIGLLRKNWQEKGDSPDIINEQLLKIGFSKADLELFAQEK